MRIALAVSVGVVALAGCFQAREDDFGIAPDLDAGPSCPAKHQTWPGWPEVQPPNFLVRANLPSGSLVVGGVLPGDTVGHGFADAGACIEIPTGFLAVGSGPPAPGAGVVSIASAGGTATLAPIDGGSQGVLYPQATLALGQRQTLSISAAGGEVPPFAFQLDTPGYLDVTVSEAPVDGGAYTYDFARGIPLAWSGSACDDEAVVDLIAQSTDTGFIVRCAVPASEGGFVAPTWLLGGPVEHLGVSVSLYRQIAFDAGTFTVIGETASQQFEGVFFPR